MGKKSNKKKNGELVEHESAQGSTERPAVHTIEKREQVLRSGPIPDPNELAAYGDIHPELVDRIVKLAEEEAAHRHNITQKQFDIANKELDGRISITKAGQWFAFFIGITGIVAGAYCIVHGYPKSGASVALTAMTGLAVVFLVGRKSKKNKEPENTVKPQ